MGSRPSPPDPSPRKIEDPVTMTIHAYDLVAKGECSELSKVFMQNSRAFHFEAVDRFCRLLMDRLPENTPASLRVLDIGCGNGGDISLFLQYGLDCTGVDGSPAMLQLAREEVAPWSFQSGMARAENESSERGIDGPRVTFARMDARALAFKAHTYHGIWASGILYHLPKRTFSDVLGQIQTILTKNGVFFFNLKLGSGEGLDEDGVFHGAPRFFAYYTEVEVRELVEKYGLKIEILLTPGERFIGDHWLYAWVRKE